MRSKQFSLCCIFLLAAIGCQPVSLDENVLTANVPTPLALQTDQVKVVTSVPTLIPPSQPASENPATSESGALWEGDQMPVFVEVIQTTIMGNNTVESPTFGVGPSLYFYQPEIKVLMLRPTIALESKTQVLVGVTTILQTPGQVFEKREIIQYSSAQPILIQVAAYDMATDTLTIFYGDEKFDLAPGENRTFKQFGGDSNTSTVITIISNHGHLIEIQPILSDGSLR
jgi:hypothetical protein